MMRTIVHVSDLHFGAADPGLVEALRSCITSLNPDLLAVSGDLTQRARRDQFRAARRFLHSCAYPVVVVPGNHDVPLYNVFARFIAPLRGFRRHITRERVPIFADNEIAVIGADTTRSFTIKDGGIRGADVPQLVAVLDRFERGLLKVVVCHHPFDLPSGRSGRLTLPPPERNAIATLIEHGADVFVTGHLHLSYSGHSATRYGVPGRSAIVVQAGTATSSRVRGEPNAFNVLRVDRDTVTVERRVWDDQRLTFASVHTDVFVRTETGWAPGGPPAIAGSA